MCVVCCSILESAVEDIRRDVVVRRCRVHEREVDGLVGAVQKTLKAISQAKGQLNLPWLPHRIWCFNYTTHWSPESQFTFLLQTHTQWKNRKIKTLRCRIRTEDLSVIKPIALPPAILWPLTQGWLKRWLYSMLFCVGKRVGAC